MHRKIHGTKKLSLIIILFVLALIAVGIYKQKISTPIGTLLSVITFIYGFFINSIMKFSETKYITFKTNLAELSGTLQSFYSLVLLTKSEKFKKLVKENLIGFIKSMKNLDFENYRLHQDYITRLFTFFDKFKLKSKFDEVILTRMISFLGSASINRERMEVYSERYLVKESKIIFLILTFLVMVSVVLVSLGNLLLLILGGLLIIGLFYTLYLIFRLDNLQYGELGEMRQNLKQLKEFIEVN